jgi:predicted DNA-binding transcriptional regulator
MDQDQVLGWVILLGSLIGIGLYFWLLFFTPWAWLIIQISALVAVGGVLGIMAWIGYTMATTPPPTPIEDMDFDFDEEEFDLNFDEMEETEDEDTVEDMDLEDMDLEEGEEEEEGSGEESQ